MFTRIDVLIRSHSGGAPSAPDAVETIAHLMGTTGDSISIMPGSGINQHTVGNLVSSLPRGSVREVHLSGGEWKPGQAIWRKIGMGMGAPTDHEWDIWRTSANKIRAVRDVLDTL
ncbi:hypothetical protein PIIN_00986 [Serendipita indica DSM 11827]|uniref:Uncharacterized protein n=1 Tax=Serendipita indica (strain DSM 11827) TaxID=1109443 RepID=G4T7B0_SERID|nr:hypothetical protein PIIN_00986 [Serendipita indica DSM 11827]